MEPCHWYAESLVALSPIKSVCAVLVTHAGSTALKSPVYSACRMQVILGLIAHRVRSPYFDVQPHSSIAIGNQSAHGWQAVELDGIPAGSGCCFLHWQLTLAWVHNQQTVTIPTDACIDMEEVPSNLI